jgi:hypothetical protein
LVLLIKLIEDHISGCEVFITYLEANNFQDGVEYIECDTAKSALETALTEKNDELDELVTSMGAAAAAPAFTLTQ